METEMEIEKTPNNYNMNYCNICEVTCSDQYKMSRHLLTASHKKRQNGNNRKQQSVPNPEMLENIFTCEKCDFNCIKKSEWDRHIQTKKHIGEKKEKTNEFQCECGNCYSTRSGLWKHQKKCTFKMSDDELIKELLKTNIILKELIKYMFTK